MIISPRVRDKWHCVRFRSPLRGLYGSVVEACDDVLGVAWDLDPEAADVRALGEAVERAALQEEPLTVIRDHAAALGSRAIRLDDRVTFSAGQRAESPRLAAFAWDERTDSTWTPMRSPAGDRLIPVDLARVRRAGADPVRPQPMTSVGTACGADWETALSRALLESVERHAVAVAVYWGTPATQLDPVLAGAGEVVRLLGDNAELRVGLMPLAPFGAFVAIAAIVGTGAGLPQAAFGSSARFQAEDAVRSAALEAIHVFHLAWRLLRRETPLDPVPATINQRALWWACHGRSRIEEYFSRASLEPSTDPGPRGQSVAAEMGAALSAHGHEWACADITPPWVSGATVARVVVPSLLRLNINEFPFLAAPRFQAEADALARRTAAGGIAPHPFV